MTLTLTEALDAFRFFINPRLFLKVDVMQKKESCFIEVQW